MADKPRARRDLTLTSTSDEELDEIATVGPESISEAESEWRIVAPKSFRNILQAKEIQ